MADPGPLNYITEYVKVNIIMSTPNQNPQHNQLPPFPDPEQQRNFDTAVTNIREWLEPAATRHYDWEGNPVTEGITNSVTFTKFAASRYVDNKGEERLRIQTVALSDKERTELSFRTGIRDHDFEIVFSLNPKARDPNQRGLVFREVPGGEPYTGGGHPPAEMTPDSYALLANDIPKLYAQAMRSGDFAYPTQGSRGRPQLPKFVGRAGLSLRRMFGGSDKPGDN